MLYMINKCTSTKLYLSSLNHDIKVATTTSTRTGQVMMAFNQRVSVCNFQEQVLAVE